MTDSTTVQKPGGWREERSQLSKLQAICSAGDSSCRGLAEGQYSLPRQKQTPHDGLSLYARIDFLYVVRVANQTHPVTGRDECFIEINLPHAQFRAKQTSSTPCEFSCSVMPSCFSNRPVTAIYPTANRQRWLVVTFCTRQSVWMGLRQSLRYVQPMVIPTPKHSWCFTNPISTWSSAEGRAQPQ